METEHEQIMRLKVLLQVLENCENSLKQDDITVYDLIEIFQELKDEYSNEFMMFELSRLAIPLLTPVIKEKFKLWEPFSSDDEASDEKDYRNIAYCYEIFSSVKTLLTSDNNQDIKLYYQIIWETWMPKFRNELNQQNIRSCVNKCVDLLNKWSSHLIPNSIVENIIQQIILPKVIIKRRHVYE
jgi:hypothetical protein